MAFGAREETLPQWGARSLADPAGGLRERAWRERAAARPAQPQSAGCCVAARSALREGSSSTTPSPDAHPPVYLLGRDPEALPG